MNNEEAKWDTVTPLPGMTLDEVQIVPQNGRLVVLFHTVQRRNNFKSLKENREVWEERIHVTKIVPGDAGLVIDRPIRESDKQEYAQQWAHWQRTRENHMPGTHVEMWHAVNETQRAEFKAMKIYTVEQFASLPDSMAGKIMGFYELRRRAQTFIEAGKDAELVAKIKAESQEQIQALQAQLDSVMKAMREQKSAARPARSRSRRRPKPAPQAEPVEV